MSRRYEESIYSLIPQPEEKEAKPPMYRSKYPPNVPPTASTFGRSTASQILATNIGGGFEDAPRNHRWKQGGSTLGPKDIHYSDPTSYLTKNNKPALAQPKAFEYNDRRKPPVVTRKEKPQMGVKRKTNFIRTNAISAIVTKPPLRDDGPMKYTQKQDYGKVPAYLDRVKQEVAVEKEYIDSVLAQEQEYLRSMEPRVSVLPEEERQRLLKNLKAKWEVVNKEYQTMTHLVTLDTIGKVRRKEEFEAELKKLEQSIEKLSKPVVMVQEF